jgi:hypothetical protein
LPAKGAPQACARRGTIEPQPGRSARRTTWQAETTKGSGSPVDGVRFPRKVAQVADQLPVNRRIVSKNAMAALDPARHTHCRHEGTLRAPRLFLAAAELTDALKTMIR